MTYRIKKLFNRRIFLFTTAIVLLSACEYEVDGRIKNTSNDTLFVTITADTDLTKKSNEYNWWDSTLYESAFHNSDFIDSKTIWLPNKVFKAEFKINPQEFVKIMGGLGPASLWHIHFDTLIIKKTNGQDLRIDGKENVFNAFKTNDHRLYRLEVK